MIKTRFMRLFALAALATVGVAIARNSSAAIIVGAHSSEKGNANFSFGGDTTSASASVASAAVGLTGTNSIYGGNGVAVADTYVFSYTPGTDADNTTYAAGAILGSTTSMPGQGNVATGLAGGLSGIYNVYFTTPSTTGISGGPSIFTVSQNGASIVLNADLNDGGTGPDTDPGPAFVGGANNAWFKLGSVDLLAGTTYTVSQAATSNTFVSQRAHAVMWEYVGPAVPEPATFALASAGLLGVAVVVRRRGA